MLFSAVATSDLKPKLRPEKGIIIEACRSLMIGAIFNNHLQKVWTKTNN